jgi:hypothetical protein
MSEQVWGKQTWPHAHERLDAVASRPQHHGLVDHVPAHGASPMPAEGPCLIERKQPPMPIGWRIDRQAVLTAPAAAPNRRPSVMELVLIGEPDYDVSARHAAQLVEYVMDRVGVLEHVERDDDVRFIIRHRDPFVHIRQDVGWWVDVQAAIPDGMRFKRPPERLIPAPDV